VVCQEVERPIKNKYDGRMNIQLLSDLHINYSNIELNCVGTDVLINAGDLSNDTDGLVEWLERRLPEGVDMVYVPGNHEYEHKNFWTYAAELKESVAHLPNVHVLQNDVWEKDGVRFLGTTLWTDFKAYGHLWTAESCKELASTNIIDFKRIRGREGFLTPNEMAEANRVARRFLDLELAKPYEGKTVVVSHFLPSRQCVSAKYGQDKINAYYVSDMEEMMSAVDVWCFGHTHDSVDKQIGKTHVRCNPRGYSKLFNVAENQTFQPTLQFEVVSDLKNNVKCVSDGILGEDGVRLRGAELNAQSRTTKGLR
jgi:predicted phosphodiesterase